MKRLKERYRYSIILLKQLVKADFKLRYQGSILGYLWSVLKPLFLFSILYIVFVQIVGVDYGVKNSGGYLLLGIVLWSFFAELTGGSVVSIVSKGDLLRKINFPKHVIVLSVAFSASINLALNLLIVLIFMIVGGASIRLETLFTPLLLAELFVLSLALAFFLSATYVRLRDIGHIWDVLMQALFYLTPILFPITFAPLWAQKVLILNPLAQIIQDMRFLLVSEDSVTISNIFSSGFMRIIPISVSLVLCAVCIRYFKSRSLSFAEDI